MRNSRLRVLSWQGGWGSAFWRCVAEPFTAQFGIEVEIFPHVGLSLPDPLPQVDLVWCNTIAAHKAASLGQVLPCSPQIKDACTALSTRILGALDGIVHAYSIPYVLVYNHQRVTSFESWRDLLKPEYYGKIAFYPGGNGFFPIAQVVGGGCLEEMPDNMAPCWRFLEQLVPQLGHLDYSIGMEKLFEQEKILLAFRALTNALAFAEAGLPVSWMIPKEGTCVTEDGFFIPKDTPEPQVEAAESLIQFTLTPSVQTQWCKVLGAIPMHLSAQTPELIVHHPLLPSGPESMDKVLRLPKTVELHYSLEWEKKFSQLVRCHREKNQTFNNGTTLNMELLLKGSNARKLGAKI